MANRRRLPKSLQDQKLEEGRSHKGVELNSGLTFGGKKPDSLKAGAHWEWAPFFETTLHGSEWRTSHPIETPVEGDVDVDEAVKQILAEMEGGRARPS